MTALAFTWPGPFEALLLFIFLLLVIGVPIFVLRRLSRANLRQAFPVLPSESSGPGKYHITGVDRSTRDDRELTVDAASRANAQVKAELDGIVVTDVKRVG